MKIGDKVDYIPTAVLKQDGDEPVSDTVITNFIRKGSIFNQDMACVEGVDHWVSAIDLWPKE